MESELACILDESENPPFLPSRRVDPHPLTTRRRAAWRGAAAVGGPALLLTAAVPELYTRFFPSVWEGMHAVVPGALAPYLALGVLFCFPALLAVPVAAVAGLVSRNAAVRGRDVGAAAAAGAGLAAAGVVFGAILASAGSAGELALKAPLFAAGGLAVGVVGIASFASLPAARRREGYTPPAYRAFLAAGLGAPALLAGGALWAGLASVIPWLSPRILESLLAAPFAEVAVATVALGALAPITYATARCFRGPSGDQRPVLAGLLFPVVVPTLGVLGILAAEGGVSTAQLGILVGCILGVLPHFLAAVLGLTPPSRFRRITSGTDTPMR